ncbi:MAG: hypothetical protein Edafosvirus47_2 [Edafosvirus sp.]|uniref:Uncharacterized protein n=1 Tax=Edafosvirus sp. TaxID=2487765 RepID=A0A3G4ZVJ5_9VIRU|nr:MAG: hypothetical protein Edafosvirus47_2 [Edafosvirus sp.]
MKNIDLENKFVFFDTYDYILKNLESYHFNWNDVWKQFMLDFPRLKICINDVKIDDHYSFVRQVMKYNNFKYNTNIDFWLIAILLGTQSSYYLPFVYMKKIYEDIDNDIMLTDSKCDKIINFEFGDIVSITFKATFKLINIKIGNITSYINTNMILMTYLENKTKLQMLNKSSLLLWNTHESLNELLQEPVHLCYQ